VDGHGYHDGHLVVERVVESERELLRGWTGSFDELTKEEGRERAPWWWFMSGLLTKCCGDHEP
jgi:hypothetical protein